MSGLQWFNTKSRNDLTVISFAPYDAKTNVGCIPTQFGQFMYGNTLLRRTLHSHVGVFANLYVRI